MEIDQQFRRVIEGFIAKHGLSELERRVERGDFIGEQKEKALALISEAKMRNLSAYMLSPEFSAIRQANAAEQSNRTAHRALIVSWIAVVFAGIAILLQIFWK